VLVMKGIPLVEIVGWAAFILNVWGNLALTNLSVRGWIIRLASNGTWLLYSASVGAWPLFGNHAVFTLINVFGYLKWQKAQAKEAPDA
jgi:hypothetical protein